MDFLPRERPGWLRAFNALGRGVEATGLRPVALDAEGLLERARRRSGLSDFGSDDFREPLEIFCSALDEEASLTLAGRLLARAEVTSWLENRLRVEQTLRFYPAIDREEVRAPIFVTGSGRSGTSILHELLAQDPANRVPRTWEVLHPCPPPRRTTYARDPRIQRAQRTTDLWDRMAPAYRAMHAGGGGVPQECIYLTVHAFRSDLLSGSYQVPSYAAWLARADLRPAYAYHRRLLGLLQWRCRGERWVLKAPSHLSALEPLLAAYPDARIVQTHRDPLQVIASMTSLLATLYWLRSDRVDPQQIARRWVKGVAYMLERAMRQRASGAVPAAQVADVRYVDFLSDPIGEIARIYERFGLELDTEAESRMRAYLDARPKARHGVHRYRFEDTGLERERERQRFAAYQACYDVPSEV